MRFLALVHGFPPLQNAGAEWMLFEMLKFLVKCGHHVEVRLPISNMTPYELEGIKVEFDHFKYTTEAIKSSDCVITHLDRAGKALNYCEFYNKPFVQIIHNTNNFDILRSKHKEKGERFVYVIYNSLYTQNAMRYPNPSCLVHPPVDPVRYKVPKKGTKLTLINLFERKGGKFIQNLARLMPEHNFLGVEGGYGKQERDDNIGNIEYMDNTSDARKIYAKTRVLLMPSIYESYGRTAVEAMCSGIPVIAAPTPGLKESLGSAGIYCNLESPLSWVEAIKKLDDPEEYKAASKLSLERSKVIKSEVQKELENMESFLMDIIFKRI